MKRKIAISMLLAITLSAALYISYDYFRLAIIRATVGSPPAWLAAGADLGMVIACRKIS